MADKPFIGGLSGVLELKTSDGTVKKIKLSTKDTQKQNGDTPHGNTSTSNRR